MPRRHSMSENRKIGEEFVQFLQETGRQRITSREELKTIYNNEFRDRSMNGCIASEMLNAIITAVPALLVIWLQRKRTVLIDQYRMPSRNVADDSSSGTLPNLPVPEEPGARSRIRTFTQQLKQNRSAFIGDKNGIKVWSEYDLEVGGRIRFPLKPEESKIVPIYIENYGKDVVTFTQYKVLRSLHVFKLKDTKGVSKTAPLQLNPEETSEVQAHCFTNSGGYFPITVVFEFEICKAQTTEVFHIVRYLSAVSNSKLADELKPTAPYKPYHRALQKPVDVLVEDGVPPSNFTNYKLEYKRKLNDYFYPPELKRIIAKIEATDQHTSDTKLQEVRSLLFNDLCFENYSERFQLLLHLEETQMEVDIKKYDLQDVVMEQNARNKRLLVLQVPGVAENRPSVLRGDYLLVSLSEDRGKPHLVQYKGYVHSVELDRVQLGFSPKNMKFDVTFTFCRLPLKVKHRAVELAEEHKLKDLLFPSLSFGESIALEKLVLFDRTLEKNPEQYAAVEHIVMGTSRPAPYLIFGPPGTGKTVTMVEAIKQVLRYIPNCHVLACAPSNSAADLLSQRLSKHESNIYRMNAYSRDWKMMPSDVVGYSNWDKAQDSYVYPPIQVLMEYKVIITTLLTAGRLVSAVVPQGHFSHVFIDEAGHAVEPECVVALAGLLSVMDPKNNKAGGQLVLAGDPEQLGPILRSRLAIKYGLDTSLLERLMTDNSLYQKDVQTERYNPQFVTKLLRNYRSHPAILKMPNELFYERELQEFAEKMISHSYCNWEYLQKKNFPIIFHGVLGEDQREGNSPSFFNIQEIEIVLSYLRKLLLTQGKKGLSKISPKDIGIIAPYRKQVEKFKVAIKSLDKDLKNISDIKELKVGSVEEFQGQERRVILISTVRSCLDYVKLDEDFNLGFLKNPKRFNVAMTRAKALLIVVGNPIVLSKDEIWRKFIRYCSDAGGYTGTNWFEDDGEQDIEDKLAALSLEAEFRGDSIDESVVQQQMEPEWRSEV
nr:PREDICTED: putative helicase MOV-10 [Latimeria chalumnae]|eukprot:XP_014347304.1 PREDICTED: putative helicase MOV-10 [Latimeria chalumnae]